MRIAIPFTASGYSDTPNTKFSESLCDTHELFNLQFGTP